MTLKKFILIFGGTTINVPSIADIKNCGRDFRIYNYIEKHKTDSKNLNEVYMNASKIFFCSQSQVQTIYSNIKKYADRLSEQKKKLEQVIL